MLILACMLKNIYKALKKIIVGLAGVAVIISGIILLPLPGPGWLVILLGLIILSTEFDWAKRLKDKLRARLDQIIKKAKSKQNQPSAKTNSAKNTDRPGDHKSQSKD